MNILVLGIGQSLRGDDAAGLEAVRLWQEHYPQSAEKLRVECCELPGLGLLQRLEGIQAAVLVDALHAPAAPGTLYRLGPELLAAFSPDTQSAHGWGVAETLSIGRLLDPTLAGCRITLIGIVGGQCTLGAGLSPAVNDALGAAALLIEKEVHILLE